MKQTYDEAMQKVFADEGGYTNDAADPGGPTNWGITIYDARLYWKPNATASDVKSMPKSVAEEIYRKHYANDVHYDDLPPGVDYAVLDYGINSGVVRAKKVLQRLCQAPVDGVIGPITIADVQKQDPVKLINAIYDERLSFLRSLRTWGTFGKGWSRRCKEGRALALKLNSKYKSQISTPTKEPQTMFNWKTTLAGISAIFAAIGSIFTAQGTIDLSHLSTVLPAILAGIGLLFSKDANVTGGTVSQVKPA